MRASSEKKWRESFSLFAKTRKKKYPDFPVGNLISKPYPTSPRGVKKKISILRDAFITSRSTFDQISRSQSKWNRTIDRLWPLRSTKRLASCRPNHHTKRHRSSTFLCPRRRSQYQPYYRIVVKQSKEKEIPTTLSIVLGYFPASLDIARQGLALVSKTAFNLSHKSTALRNKHKRIH